MVLTKLTLKADLGDWVILDRGDRYGGHDVASQLEKGLFAAVDCKRVD